MNRMKISKEFYQQKLDFMPEVLLNKFGHFFSLSVLIGHVLFVSNIQGQTIEWEERTWEPFAVHASLVQLDGEEVLKIERDLEAIPFDLNNLANTVDEPTYVKLKNLNIENGAFEVKMLSRIQIPTPFKGAQGFIGVAFRANEENTAFESIYLRPNVGRSKNQSSRNHTVQYYAYPDYKFDQLRNPKYKGQYETYADIGLDEWITMRIEFKDKVAQLFLNNQEYPSFIVNTMKGSVESGSIALWVDIGTEGYFKDFRIIEMK